MATSAKPPRIYRRSRPPEVQHAPRITPLRQRVMELPNGGAPPDWDWTVEVPSATTLLPAPWAFDMREDQKQTLQNVADQLARILDSRLCATTPEATARVYYATYNAGRGCTFTGRTQPECLHVYSSLPLLLQGARCRSYLKALQEETQHLATTLKQDIKLGYLARQMDTYRTKLVATLKNPASKLLGTALRFQQKRAAAGKRSHYDGHLLWKPWALIGSAPDEHKSLAYTYEQEAGGVYGIPLPTSLMTVGRDRLLELARLYPLTVGELYINNWKEWNTWLHTLRPLGTGASGYKLERFPHPLHTLPSPVLAQYWLRSAAEQLMQQGTEAEGSEAEDACDTYAVDVLQQQRETSTVAYGADPPAVDPHPDLPPLNSAPHPEGEQEDYWLPQEQPLPKTGMQAADALATALMQLMEEWKREEEEHKK